MASCCLQAYARKLGDCLLEITTARAVSRSPELQLLSNSKCPAPSWPCTLKSRDSTSSDNSSAATQIQGNTAVSGRAAARRPALNTLQEGRDMHSSPALDVLYESRALHSSPAVSRASLDAMLEGRAVSSSPAMTHTSGHSPEPSNSAVDELRKWTWECSSLRAFMGTGNPARYLSFIGQRLDGRPGLSAAELDDSWLHDLLV